MTKTQKELAFLRDLYIDGEWTERFTALVDKHLGFADDKNFLYLNAGSGNHALALGEKSGKDAEFSAVCENEDLLQIAREKALAVKSKVLFSMDEFDDETFDSVLADASFVRPADLAAFVAESARLTEIGGQTAFFTIGAGSFGEVFSLLWEVLFNTGFGEQGAVAEGLIAELPTVSELEKMAATAGLEDIETHQSNEVFEFENGANFVGSPLVADFLLPVWLKNLSAKEKEQVTEKLAQLIDEEDGTLSFRFSVKAVLVVGSKG